MPKKQTVKAPLPSSTEGVDPIQADATATGKSTAFFGLQAKENITPPPYPPPILLEFLPHASTDVSQQTVMSENTGQKSVIDPSFHKLTASFGSLDAGLNVWFNIAARRPRLVGQKVAQIVQTYGLSAASNAKRGSDTILRFGQQSRLYVSIAFSLFNLSLRSLGLYIKTISSAPHKVFKIVGLTVVGTSLVVAPFADPSIWLLLLCAGGVQIGLGKVIQTRFQ